MRDEDVFPREILRHGAYVCLTFTADRPTLAAAPVPALVERLGLLNEFDPAPGQPGDAIAFLRRVSAAPGDIPDDALAGAAGVLHVASGKPDPVAEFSAEIARLLHGAAQVRILSGVVRPRSYTSATMNNFAYAHAVVQQPAARMPNAFLVPMSKTAEWWAKDWMERHTYFLPRYDDQGRMTAEGHTLAAEAGIACLLRRTFRSPREPAPEGAYDFLTYFECSDADVPTFHQVCASLRDVRKNPEWRFVREGPTWHGRRVRDWAELVTGTA